MINGISALSQLTVGGPVMQKTHSNAETDTHGFESLGSCQWVAKRGRSRTCRVAAAKRGKVKRRKARKDRR